MSGWGEVFDAARRAIEQDLHPRSNGEVTDPAPLERTSWGLDYRQTALQAALELNQCRVAHAVVGATGSADQLVRDAEILLAFLTKPVTG